MTSLRELITSRAATFANAATAAATVAVAASVSCSDDAEEAAAGFSMPPTPVETAVATARTVADRFSAIGTLAAGERITVVSEIDGTVVEIPYREGDPIRRGDLIARLDQTQTAAQVRRAQALLDQRRSSYERIRKVVEKGAGARQDLDDAAAALKVADADLAVQNARLDKTVISAPFAGLVGTRRISAGAFVRAGEAITDLVQVSSLRVYFSVPERYLAQLKRGVAVTVATTAFPDYELSGSIDVVEPIVDADTRSARVMARLDNPERKLLPGMSADVTAILSQREDAITVPSEAVFVSGSEHLAYVVREDGTVARRILVLGARASNYVEVVEGIAAHEVVVRSGHQKLYEGAAVQPLQGQAAP